MGQQCYYAIEDNDCCTRNMCGNLRSFEMKIVDMNGKLSLIVLGFNLIKIKMFIISNLYHN